MGSPTDAESVLPRDTLGRYLREHYAASRGGLDLCERSARSHGDPVVRRSLQELATDLAEDRATLLSLLLDLGVEPSHGKERLVALGERMGRLKRNGTVLRRLRLSDLLELEALDAMLEAKKLGWLCLLNLSDVDHRLNPYHLGLLVKRAEVQQDRVGALRSGLAVDVLAHSA